MTATAIAVDPHHLPVPARSPGRRALISVNHAWVLHKRRFVQLLAAGIVCVAVAGAYEARHAAGELFGQAVDLAQAKAADFGFAVDAISITGQALSKESDILEALAIEPRMSMFDFDADAARARIEKLPAVANATVRKNYPGRVTVTITEKKPVARWRVDGVTFLVDARGDQIADADHAFGDLPLVIGDGASAHAMPMIVALDRFAGLKTGLAALSRIGDRRWDMLYFSGVRVQLPESGVAQALNQLNTLQQKYALLDRDVTTIDLRVPGMVEITPSADAIAQLKAMAKAQPKRKLSGDSEYETPAERQGAQ